MKQLKHLYLYFQDGQRLALRFPKQSEDPAAVARALRKQLETPFLSIEVDGDLLMIPRESIKYLQVCPMPAALPELTIQGEHGFPYQLDGDYLGETRLLEFRHVPDAVRLVRPQPL